MSAVVYFSVNSLLIDSSGSSGGGAWYSRCFSALYSSWLHHYHHHPIGPCGFFIDFIICWLPLHFACRYYFYLFLCFNQLFQLYCVPTAIVIYRHILFIYLSCR